METKVQYHQYFSSRPKLGIAMPNGKKLNFNAGVLFTADPDEIEFLDKEIKAKNPMIYVKKGEEVVSEAALDPLAALRKKIIAEHEAAITAQTDPTRDMGNSNTEKAAGITTTHGIASITVGSKSK